MALPSGLDQHVRIHHIAEQRSGVGATIGQPAVEQGSAMSLESVREPLRRSLHLRDGVCTSRAFMLRPVLGETFDTVKALSAE